MNVHFEANEYCKLVETFEITSDEIQTYHDKFVEEGDEGIIIRFKKDGGYQQKRSNSMYKYKNFIDDEFEVVGLYPEKNNENKLGGMNCIDKDGNEFDARPSFTHKEMDYMWNNPDEFIGQMATVRYQKTDDKSGVPIFGTIKGFRAKGDI